VLYLLIKAIGSGSRGFGLQYLSYLLGNKNLAFFGLCGELADIAFPYLLNLEVLDLKIPVLP